MQLLEKKEISAEQEKTAAKIEYPTPQKTVAKPKKKSATQKARLSVTTRLVRYKLRKAGRFVAQYRTSPAIFGIAILTMASVGFTLASYVMERLLPDKELIMRLAETFPENMIEFFKSIPQLLTENPPAATIMNGAVLSQEPYILTQACAVATIFCFLLLLIAFIKKW